MYSRSQNRAYGCAYCYAHIAWNIEYQWMEDEVLSVVTLTHTVCLFVSIVMRSHMHMVTLHYWMVLLHRAKHDFSVADKLAIRRNSHLQFPVTGARAPVTSGCVNVDRDEFHFSDSLVIKVYKSRKQEVRALAFPSLARWHRLLFHLSIAIMLHIFHRSHTVNIMK